MKKNTIIGITAALLGMAIIVGFVIFGLKKKSESDKIIEKIENGRERVDEIIENAPDKSMYIDDIFEGVEPIKINSDTL